MTAFPGETRHEGSQFLARFVPLADQQQRREGSSAAFVVPAQVPHEGREDRLRPGLGLSQRVRQADAMWRCMPEIRLSFERKW